MQRLFRLSIAIIALLTLFMSVSCQSSSLDPSKQSSVFWPSASNSQVPDQPPDVSFRAEYLDCVKKVSILPNEPIDCVSVDETVAYCPIDYDSNIIDFQYLYPYSSDCSTPVNIDLGNDGSIETLCYMGKAGLLIYRDGELIDLVNIKIQYSGDTTDVQKISDIYVINRNSDNGIYTFLIFFSPRPCTTDEKIAEVFYDSSFNEYFANGVSFSYFEYDINQASLESPRTVDLDKYIFYSAIGTDGHSFEMESYSELFGNRVMMCSNSVDFISNPTASDFTFPAGSKTTYELYLSKDVSVYTTLASDPLAAHVDTAYAHAFMTLIGSGDGTLLTDSSSSQDGTVSYVFKDELADSLSSMVRINLKTYYLPDPYGSVRPSEYVFTNMSFKCEKLISDDRFEECTIKKGTWLCPIESDMNSYVIFRDFQGNTYRANLRVEDEPITVYTQVSSRNRYGFNGSITYEQSFFINGIEQNQLFYYPGYYHVLFYANNAELKPLSLASVR